MKEIIETLEKKWNKFNNRETCLVQCCLDGYDDYLNVVFKPIASKNYKYVYDLLDWNIPDDLKSFYKECNGLSLFSESLLIYGATNDNNDIYNTTDIVHENAISKLKKSMSKYSDMIIFGSYGYYYFCYKKDYDKKIYVIGSVEKDVVHTFKSIDELLKYYVTKLLNEYDSNGIKKHKNVEMLDTPMENTSYEYI